MPERATRLELSVSLPTWWDEGETPASWSEMRDLAQQAEAIGVDAIFVADHTGFDQPSGPSAEFWDGWTLLPALAEVTRKVTLGPLVSVPSMRHPVVLARMAAALDEVSGGRAMLGLGAGGAAERAWRVLGVSKDRLYTRFEEAIKIVVPLLRDGAVDFQGAHFVAHGATLGAAGPRNGGVPIWIGAVGQRMMRLAARWADAVNFGRPLSSPDVARALIEDFENVCREVAREPSTVRRTGWSVVSFAKPEADPLGARFGALRGEATEIAAQLHAFHRAGLDHLSVYINPGDPPVSERTLPVITATGLERFGRVIVALRALELQEPI